MRDPLVKVEGLTVSYGSSRLSAGRWVAARDVSFDILPGECVALVGESGSGKSTVAKTLVGLASPDSGSIRIGEHRIPGLSKAQWTAVRSMVGMVFQDPYLSLNPRMSIGRQILEPLVVSGVARSQHKERLDEVLSTVRLSRTLLDRRPAHLSGGQRQRACIARALIRKPQLLIADEPVSALDLSVQAQIVDLLGDLTRNTGVTLLLITHDLELVRFLAHRVLVMMNGILVEQATPDDLFARPVHPYTRMLMGAVPTRLSKETLSGYATLPNPPAASGCPFRTNCPGATSPECETLPGASQHGPGHVFRCHHPL